MRLSGLIFGLCLSSASATAAFAQSAIGLAEAPDALEGAPWNNRLLVVCEAGNGVDDPPLLGAQYDEAFKDWPGYIERDLILVWISSDYIMSWKPVPNPDKAATLLIGGHESDPTGLREQVDCGDASKPGISLIGKDSDLKKVWNEKVGNADVFQLIDAMPMRQREIRREQRPN